MGTSSTWIGVFALPLCAGSRLSQVDGSGGRLLLGHIHWAGRTTSEPLLAQPDLLLDLFSGRAKVLAAASANLRQAA
ncbi:hypothetical protein [Streptomyces sp. NPDC060031]|uniref:hypothetical protein n=1 Tax=Streptomyces sp. NPDC060031 TaxID=3347043 RepID=UPI00368689FC